MSPSTENLELVCTLNDKDFAERRMMVRKEITPHISKVDRLENGVRYHFTENMISRESVEEFAEFERGCCGFLTFTLSLPRESLTLLAEGPPDAQTLYDELANGAMG